MNVFFRFCDAAAVEVDDAPFGLHRLNTLQQERSSHGPTVTQHDTFADGENCMKQSELHPFSVRFPCCYVVDFYYQSCLRSNLQVTRKLLKSKSDKSARSYLHMCSNKTFCSKCLMLSQTEVPLCVFMCGSECIRGTMIMQYIY